ncbi:MAG: hypothetical protein A2428_09880 [Bdellovibrionales bacterium RIFOXYC1_FULL_54_43]|nr:MAG: hypothetical protein A2428_09880 [Bdellovibrionales bacterium RIFOXYC1_FULL_54_43]OFZ82363.1 MAG: hypothetical protein A2603_03805 [Bdellovibrionales bacterium RIFOXYD1_FULL_55_31]
MSSRFSHFLAAVFYFGIASAFATILAGEIDSPNTLKAGLYVPRSGLVESREQKVRPVMENGKLVGIKVVYLRADYYDGPYHYPCAENWGDLACVGPGVAFVIHDSEHFLWHDKYYGVWAEMGLKEAGD